MEKPNDVFEERTFISGEMAGPDRQEVVPGFYSVTEQERQDYERKMDSLNNLIVFIIIVIAMMPLFFFGRQMFNTPSSEHFLVGLPLIDFNSLQPVIGGEPAPATHEFKDKNFFVILWGPWDDPSCELLQRLWSPLQKAEKLPNFQVIPITYFAKTVVPVKWYEMDRTERQRFLEQKRLEQSRLDRFVKEAFRVRGFHFKNVWWDPADRFRLDLMDLAQEELKGTGSMIDGIGFPTILHVENGVIRHVWTSGTQEDLNEINDVLALIIAGPKEIPVLPASQPSSEK